MVTAEIGDSWVYGCGSDPLKLAAMQVLQRHHDKCVASAACLHLERGFPAFQRYLLLTGKHTWGGHTIIEDDGAHDTTHYTAEQLASVRFTSKAFITQQISWDEMRLQLWATRDALGGDSLLGEAIDKEMALMTGGPDAAAPLGVGDGWKAIAPEQYSAGFTIGGLEMALDAETGAIVSLRRSGVKQGGSKAGHDWASPAAPLARFAYVTHDDSQAQDFFSHYKYSARSAWAAEGFTKPGVNPQLANASTTYGKV